MLISNSFKNRGVNIARTLYVMYLLYIDNYGVEMVHLKVSVFLYSIFIRTIVFTYYNILETLTVVCLIFKIIVYYQPEWSTRVWWEEILMNLHCWQQTFQAHQDRINLMMNTVLYRGNLNFHIWIVTKSLIIYNHRLKYLACKEKEDSTASSSRNPGNVSLG
jgi:hypothetical protein